MKKTNWNKLNSFVIALFSLLILFSSSCNSEEECMETIERLNNEITAYKQDSESKKELLVQFDSKIEKFGHIQDSIELREEKIEDLKMEIRTKGYASRSDNKVLKALLGEIDSFLDVNKELAQEFDSVDLANSSQEQIVKLLLNSVNDKQKQINNLKTSIVDLKKEVKGLVMDNEILVIKTDSLTQETEDLKIESSEIKKKAQLLTLYDFRVAPLLQNGKTAKRAAFAKKVKITFSLNQNEFVNSGSKKVYIRISDPSGNFLYSSASDVFIYQGKKLQYAMTTQVNYNNAQKISKKIVEWSSYKKFKSGTYQVSLFVEGVDMGTKSFSLKKY